RNVRVRDLSGHLLGLLDRALDAVVAGRQNDFAAEGTHDLALFHGEVFGDAEDDAITHAHAGERQTDAGVAGRGLDDRAALLQQSVAFGARDHADADAVLDRASRVEELQLRKNLGVLRSRDVPQAQHRRVADEIENVVDGLTERAGQTRGIVV